jgi:uncharacterized membrane protein (UPF0136 family)
MKPGHRPGLSEIAFVPSTIAGLSTLITAFWWAPHLWRQSSSWGVVFAVDALACFVLLQLFTIWAYGETHGIPSLLTSVIGFGVTYWQIRLVIHLTRIPEPFGLWPALVLNHLPVWIAVLILAFRAFRWKRR